MILFGLTGGVGMGKSTSGNLLARTGIPVVDTDQIAHDLVEPGQPALDEIKDAFGPEMIAPDGCLRRRVLAAKVFAGETARRRLEAILHPKIRAVWQAKVESWRSRSVQFGAVVIPLLFETDAAALFERTICAACSQPTQQSRLKARGWTDEEIGRRLSSQWPVENKIALSNFVVWTDTTIEAHAAQLDRILKRCAWSDS